MSSEIFMPALGMNQESGKLIEWLVPEGSSVTKGQPIMVVETDKATVELEAPATGTLTNVAAKAGDDVPVGKVIALILEAGEPSAPGKVVTPPAAVSAGTKPASPLAARLAEEHGIDLSQVSASGKRIQKEDVLAYLARQRTAAPAASSPLLASPKARRLGQELNVDLRALKGSGPEGAVLAMDVMGAVAARQAAAVALPAAPVPAAPPPAPPAPDVLPASRMWQVMAQRLTESWQTVPHFYLEAEANAARLKAWRAGLLERSEEKITFTDLIVKLVAIALRRHPRLNASWLDGSIRLNSAVNIGLAIAVEDGLLVPVIHDADQMGVQAIAARRKVLVAGAQANRLNLADLSGGTFTISNLGMYSSVDAFSAIVNPPEAAILALGRISDKIVPIDGQPVVQPMLRMTLSCDHRVVDGARSAAFLQTLVAFIEDPLAALD